MTTQRTDAQDSGGNRPAKTSMVVIVCGCTWLAFVIAWNVLATDHLTLARAVAVVSAAVGAGCELPTLTDGFTGSAPDLGAYERGKPLPVYGPRPAH